ncbi:hypothetical protein AT3G14340 [Arabidopsis thaliana]|uniref:At3g14340 n=1 Tax=Arabidopsis thaliana TaxID=3702 RepID=Q3EB64_ARATH|nr:uncharacterized protein AT3G14340 [Arabidopsis thaliana]ABK32169.1 At3g14340 [Arabidopsis thaliana]AEE75503.1 hypothetical protein AT3G14340 [Arabidopsis thaliana]|eukprot:NP_188051.1 hypothetical protein AT3G14340 [Arabidopsis thaliana]
MVLFMLSESKKKATNWEQITKKHGSVQCVKGCCCYSLIISFMKPKEKKDFVLFCLSSVVTCCRPIQIPSRQEKKGKFLCFFLLVLIR